MNIEKPIKKIDAVQLDIDFDVGPDKDKKEEEKKVVDFPNDKEDPSWEYYGRFLDNKKQAEQNPKKGKGNNKNGETTLFPPFDPYK